MANLEPLIQSIPVAPLKLASLEGCRTLADQVNNYLVSFRHESPTNVGQADSLQGYCADSYLLECECRVLFRSHVSEAAKEKAF